MKLHFRYSILAVCFSVLTACINVPVDESIVANTDDNIQQVERLSRHPKSQVIDKPYVDPSPIYTASNKYEFLAGIHGVEIIQEFKDPSGLPLFSIIQILKGYGINVSSNLSLEDYYYNGFSIAPTDALTALEILTSSMDLDFAVREGEQGPYVQIVPMQMLEYTLAIPNRDTIFNLQDNGFSAEDSLSALSGSGSGGESSQSSGAQSGSDKSGSSVKIENTFYKDLDVELKQLLTRLVPVSNRPRDDQKTTNGLGPANGPHNKQPLNEVRIGAAFINRSTGHITVQAPSYAREIIRKYLEKLDSILSTRIEIEGKIIVVADNDIESKGFDFSSLIEFGSDYGLAFSNGIFNQIQLTRPVNGVGTFNVAIEGSPASAGVISNDGLLSIFNAYVESQSNIRTVLEPKLSATSGSLATYSRSTPFLFTNYQGSTTQNESNTTSSSENNIIPINFGLSIKVYPTYDADNDTIRTVVDLVQVFRSTTQTIEQNVNGQIVQTEIPVPDTVTIQSESIVKNGGMIILGGQNIETFDKKSEGVSGLKDSFVGGLFGNSSSNGERSKYYFVFTARAINQTSSLNQDSSVSETW